MFDFPNTKMFRDSVHGYIDIPKCFVENIIDIEMFQRLRNIDQTGMRVLYPSAKHDRFGHSIGVYHLGCKAVNTILDYFSQDKYWLISSDGKAITFWAKNKLLFLLACLLHDIGHAPYSHALEETVVLNSRRKNTTISIRLANAIRELEDNSENITNITSAPHEQIGALYILENMRGEIEKIYDSLIKEGYPKENSNDFLYAEHYKLNTTINKDDMKNDLAYIARMILGLKYKSFEPEKQIKNCFIELLNSSNFDVDKLDYVIRDTKMSGISNISIDTDRLLNSVCIVTKTKYIDTIFCKDNYKELVATRISGTSNESKIKIDGSFRGIIEIYKGAEVTIQKGSTFISLMPKDDGLIMYPDNAKYASFSKETLITQNSEKINRVVNDEIVLESCNGRPFSFKIENAMVRSDFHFIVCHAGEKNGVVLNVNGKCTIEIKGQYSTKSPVRIFNATLDGRVSEMEIVDTDKKRRDIVPTQNCFNEFSIGFKKQAINVIANVMEARDYLYLWIYAHHKVVYYANFLVPIIANNVLTMRDNSWKLDYDDIRFIDDAYVWTMVKDIYIRERRQMDPELEVLCRELFSRKYRQSLYKSLAEFDLLFEKIPIYKRMDIKSYMREQLSGESYQTYNSGAGYLSNNFLNMLKKRAKGKLDNIQNVVFVDAAYSNKLLDANSTLIVTNSTVASLGEIPLLANEPKNGVNAKYYFYLYYDTKTAPEDRANEATEFKEVISEIMNSKIQRKNLSTTLKSKPTKTKRRKMNR